MSRVASYLQEHISGMVSSDPAILEGVSTDGSILRSTPELVIYPRNTNDVRKVMRFCWQLAERGHVLPITARGGGSDPTGAAIGKGIILSFAAYMNGVFEYEPKRKLVRVQPGMSTLALHSALSLHGSWVPTFQSSSQYTVGGAVANNFRTMLTGKYGQVGEWVEQLELVLANGEVIQTGRISKRELAKKKGFQTLEGELYRSLDNLIEDNALLVAQLYDKAQNTNAGYTSLGLVKQRDGSFDLTPLFTGSQGTLGIISEMILRADLITTQRSVMLVLFTDTNDARDSIPGLADCDPAYLEYFDGEFIQAALREGKKFGYLGGGESDIQAALLVGFNDSSDRRRRANMSKAEKMASSSSGRVLSGESVQADELLTFRDVLMFSKLPSGRGLSAPPLLTGIYVPTEQFDVFNAGVKALERKYRMKLPIYGDELSLLYSLWPALNLSKTSDKQKALMIIDDMFKLVDKTGGELIGSGGEGRLKSRFTSQSFSEEANDVFNAVKTIFDPYGILNPGVKQPNEIRHLAPMIRDEYDTSFFA